MGERFVGRYVLRGGSTQRPRVGWVAEMVGEVGYARTGIVALQGKRRWEIGRGYMNARDG